MLRFWRLDTRDAAQMQWLTLAFLAFHLILWTALATLSHRAPPWDNTEQLVWMQSLEWGYYKHPPFPTWWVHGWTELLGRKMWVTFFAAQLSVVLMQFFIWRIALMVTTPVRAFASVVLSSLLVYHGIHGIMANHNTLQLMPVGLLLWLTLGAVRAQGGAGQQQPWWRWALVGVAAALCLLSKYSALVWLAVIGLWLAQDRRMWHWRAWVGVALALAVCALLVSPHISWLLQEGSPGLGYAGKAMQGKNDHDNLGHWARLANFWVVQLGRVLPLLLGLGALLLLLKRALHKAQLQAQLQAQPAELDACPSTSPEWRFVLFMGLGPMLLTTLLGAFGIRLGSAWAATYFVMAGVLALLWLPSKPGLSGALLLRSVLWVGVVAELVLALGMAFGAGWLADMGGRGARSNFPAARLARQLDAVWLQHAKTPLRVVVGETWLAGNVSVRSRFQPLVYLDADPQKSPWIKPHMLDDCGALVLVDGRDLAQPLLPAVQALIDRAEARGFVKLHWTRIANRGPQLEVMWAYLPARNPAACPP
ncbi:4-amino-4-deoxy-L-arabinose transferase-like glycosyltransferase [Paucibacter oligotrophus]|uniref:4-amino-4-deoxy-L-arabinose transferase-like glycosyltransferase n=1 Tax=Roseateles oligotrophus TaxID=1769250 RepID=A0A840L1C0_9BURK|nr:glycosyltransferase family 39 protein [Roseateles oligotrophus]MBB4842040.1 4-amino-4-deoxy-L-arabinose transferase-like glycosyltransferase [Roseateles oligotrophus]